MRRPQNQFSGLRIHLITFSIDGLVVFSRQFKDKDKQILDFPADMRIPVCSERETPLLHDRQRFYELGEQVSNSTERP